jgi:hypothetical protein
MLLALITTTGQNRQSRILLKMIVGKGALAKNKNHAAVGFDLARVDAVPTKAGRHPGNRSSGWSTHVLKNKPSDLP